jgi:hypothetical protein
VIGTGNFQIRAGKGRLLAKGWGKKWDGGGRRTLSESRNFIVGRKEESLPARQAGRQQAAAGEVRMSWLAH